MSRCGDGDLKSMATSQPLSARREWGSYWKLVVIATFGSVLSSSAGFLVGVGIPSMEKEFGWTRAEISSGPMLISIASLLLSTAAGYLIDRIGARKVGIMVVIAMTGSIALMSTMTNSLWQWWALWAVFGIASAATATVWLAPVTTLFTKSRGLALAFVLTGTGVSGATIPPLANYFVQHGDWRMSYLVVGAIQAAIMLPLVLMFWRGAEEFAGLSNAAGDDEQHAADVLPGLTPREGFRSPAFYKIIIAFTIGTLGVAGVVINLVPVLIATGISPGEAAAIAGTYGLTGIAGRFLGGWALDHVDPKWLTVGPTLLITALPITLLTQKGVVPVAFAAGMFAAFLSGLKYPSLTYLVSIHFGAKSFGTLFGTISIGGAIGAGAGPMLVSYIYDVTRSYDLALWLMIPGLMIAAALFASLGRPPDFTATAGRGN
jgi:MFS family permease